MKKIWCFLWYVLGLVVGWGQALYLKSWPILILAVFCEWHLGFKFACFFAFFIGLWTDLLMGRELGLSSLLLLLVVLAAKMVHDRTLTRNKNPFI